MPPFEGANAVPPVRLAWMLKSYYLVENNSNERMFDFYQKIVNGPRLIGKMV